MRKIQRNRILAIGAILMAATINNLNLSGIVYAQQETSTISYENQLEGEIKLETKQLKFPFKNWESTALEIEEVYVKNGTTLKEGDPILKISSESMQKLLEYYNNQIDAAQAEVEEKQVSYELQKRNAEYEREQAKQNGEMAASVRDTQLQLLQSDTAELAKQIEQIRLQITNYETALTNNSYYSEYGITDMATALEESRRLMEEAQRMLSEAQNGSQNADSAAVQLLQNMVNQAEKSYNLLQKQYSKLLSDYGRKVSDSQTEKNELQDRLSFLEEEYSERQEENEFQTIEINKQYDRAILRSNQAEKRYEIAIEQLEEALDEARANLEKWEKARDELYAREDGIIYAQQDMTVSSFRYHNGDEIEEDVLSYEDASSVLMEVNVPQDEIIDWNIGDTVKIRVEGYEELFSGTVSSMELGKTVQADEIEYKAVIAIEQGEEQLKEGLAATVLFGAMAGNEENQEVEHASEASEEPSEPLEPGTELSAEQLGGTK